MNDTVAVRGRAVFGTLRGKLPPICVREIVEAAFGLKPARVYISAEHLDVLCHCAELHGFQLELGSYKYHFPTDDGKWFDGAASTSPLEATGGYLAAYVSTTGVHSEQLRCADEEGTDAEFGRLLGIPSCCIDSYLRDGLAGASDTDEVLRQYCGNNRYTSGSPGASFLGQYFSRSFLSHYPCTLSCEETRSVTRDRLSFWSRIDKRFASWTKEGHLVSIIWEPGVRASAWSGLQDVRTGLPSTVRFVDVAGSAPDDLKRVTEIEVTGDGFVRFAGVGVSRLIDDAFHIFTFPGEW
jgi:hypothetical protein